MGGCGRGGGDCGGGVVDLSLFLGFAGGGTIFGGGLGATTPPFVSGRVVRRESSLHDLQVAISACVQIWFVAIRQGDQLLVNEDVDCISS